MLVLLLCLASLSISHEGVPPLSSSDQEIAELKLDFKEEMLNLRKEVQDILGGSERSLFWMIRELIEEVREYQEEVAQQNKVMMLLKSDMAAALQKLDEAKKGLDEVREGQLVQRKGFDLVRSEVRLISQHKLTWQNTTDGYRTADFLVDGVYTRSKDEAINPIQHNKLGVNQVVSIDLGGFFKIHTVKIWNRLSYQDRGSSLIVYADKNIIGVTSGSHDIYSVVAGDKIYARTIIIRQPNEIIINLREVQVFGSGPYEEEECA